jgi:hypothetical protein
VTEVRYIQIDEILAIARTVNGTAHSVRDMGLLVSAIDRPRTDVFGTELYPTLHEKAAALLRTASGGLVPSALTFDVVSSGSAIRVRADLRRRDEHRYHSGPTPGTTRLRQSLPGRGAVRR